MKSQLLAIEDRRKPVVAGAVRPSDFSYHEVRAIDPGFVLEDATLILFCLDPIERVGLFVRTQRQIQLGRAPFLYVAQYEAATELVSVPFDEMHRLAAAALVPSERLVMLYSTARCGSTLS